MIYLIVKFSTPIINILIELLQWFHVINFDNWKILVISLKFYVIIIL